MTELSPLDELRAMGATENVTERAKGYMEPDEDPEVGRVFKELSEDGTIMKVKVGEKNYKDLQVLDAITKSKASAHEDDMSYWSGEIAKKEFIMEDPNTPIDDLGKLHNDIEYARGKYKEAQAFYNSARVLDSKKLSETGLGLAEGLGGIVSGAGYALKRYGKDAGIDSLSRGGGYLAELVEGEMQLIPQQKPGALNYISRVFGRTAPWIASMAAGTIPLVAGGIVLGHGQMQGALEREGVTDNATQAKATYLYGTMIGVLQAAVPVAVLRGLSKPATKAFYGSIGQIAAKAAAGTLHMSIAQAMTMEMVTWAEMYGVSDASGKPLDLKIFEERANEAMLEGFVSGAMFGGIGEAHKAYAGAYKRGTDPQKELDAILDEIRETLEKPVKVPEAEAPAVPPERSPVARRNVLEEELSDLATDGSQEATARRGEIEAGLAKPELPDYAPEEFAKIEQLRTNIDEIDQIIKNTEARTDLTDDEKTYVIEALDRESYVEEVKALEQEAEAKRAEWQRSPDEIAVDDGKATSAELDTPGFEEIRLVAPKDADGYPDVASLPDIMEAKFGKRKFSELTPDEKRQLYLDLAEADGGFKTAIEAAGEHVSRVTNELARIEAKIDDIRDQDGLTESEREALVADLAVHRDYVARDLEPRQVVREEAPERAAPKAKPKPAKGAPLSPEELLSARSKGESDYASTPEAVMTPDPYSEFYQKAKALGQSYRVPFQVHGLATGDRDANLLSLLEKGVDPEQPFQSGPPTPGVHGVDTTRVLSPYLIISDFAKTIPETGIKNIVLNGPAAVLKERLSAAYPDRNFMTSGEAMEFMRNAGEVPQKPAAKPVIDPIKRTAFREILRGNTSRKTWMRDLGATKEELDALIDDARRSGLVRIDRHRVVRRTALARSGEANETLVTGPDGTSTISEAAESSHTELQGIVKEAVAKVTGEDVIEVVAQDVIEEGGVIAGDENLALTKYQDATENFADGRTEGQRAWDNARREAIGEVAYQLEQRLNQETGALGTKEGNPEVRRVAQQRLDEAYREARITRSETVPRRKDGSVVAGRQSTARGARKAGAARQAMKAGSTEHFNKITGLDGRVTDVPLTEHEKRSGLLSKATYRFYDKGAAPADVETSAVPIRATVELVQRPDGAWEVSWLFVDKEQRGRGFATRVYAAIEKDLGIRMSPSGLLSDNGFAFWKKRSPASVQWHQQDPDFPSLYVSPRNISDKISGVGREMLRRGADIGRLKKERVTLMKLWGKLPPEAKAAKDDMLALRGFYHAPLRAVRMSKQTKATPEQWLSNIRKAPGVKQEALDWMGLDQWLESGAWRRDQLLRTATKDEALSDETLYRLFDAIDNGENPRSVIDTAPEAERAALAKNIKQSFESKSIAKETIEEFIDLNKADIDEVYDSNPPYADPEYNPFGSRGSNYRMLLITYPKAAGRWVDPHHGFSKHGAVMTFGRLWDLPTVTERRSLSEIEEIERADILKRHDALEEEFNKKWKDVDPDPYKDKDLFAEKDAEWTEVSKLWDRLVEYNRKEVGHLSILGVGDVQSPPHQKGVQQGYRTPAVEMELAADRERSDEIARIRSTLVQNKRDEVYNIELKHAYRLEPHKKAHKEASDELQAKYNSGEVDLPLLPIVILEGILKPLIIPQVSADDFEFCAQN